MEIVLSAVFFTLMSLGKALKSAKQDTSAALGSSLAVVLQNSPNPSVRV